MRSLLLATLLSIGTIAAADSIVIVDAPGGAGPEHQAPGNFEWLRWTRTENNLTAEYSVDGVTWMQAGVIPLEGTLAASGIACLVPVLDSGSGVSVIVDRIEVAHSSLKGGTVTYNGAADSVELPQVTESGSLKKSEALLALQDDPAVAGPSIWAAAGHPEHNAPVGATPLPAGDFSFTIHFKEMTGIIEAGDATGIAVALVEAPAPNVFTMLNTVPGTPAVPKKSEE